MVLKYLITIFNSQKLEYVSIGDIKRVLFSLNFDCNISCIYGKWERHGVYKQLHFHGVFTVPNQFIYSTCTRIGPLTLRFDRIKSYDKPYVKKAIHDYIDKHYHGSDRTQTDTEIENYYHHHYGFSQ